MDPQFRRRGARVRATFAGVSVALLALFAGLAACGGGEDPSNPDCTEAERIWGQKTKGLGQECFSGSYGSCEVSYNDCVEGACHTIPEPPYTVCASSCTSDGDCGGDYCREGFCIPGATCQTYCDGVCCCEYHQDPTDPTKCQQGQCHCS